MNFRYFDAAGKQLTSEQLKTMNIVTPAMEHIFATVTDRIGKVWIQSDRLEAPEQKQYNQSMASREGPITQIGGKR